ncbi:hypothetical protein IMG5_198810 [Ichthyophthirius multifiliis]|uniref:Uncharacterized protein n=1 Tax=Ichthyophthirius multifiliis TaxID=5932 RepID=G0R5G7_ICHMU|nr:hypothetical protein IMG5_198810 [Ichthyophthirius multifiliis]EGR27289.1 hypothetical protein IMG5_198810 [Ichthyophthirius multifiliis]|eukprot:XP_004024173.1 hypothetical protein IMG5_198810 [Ichthyophthirius multifiliis]
MKEQYNSEIQKLKRDLAVQFERVKDLTIEKQSLEEQYHQCRIYKKLSNKKQKKPEKKKD